MKVDYKKLVCGSAVTGFFVSFAALMNLAVTAVTGNFILGALVFALVFSGNVFLVNYFFLTQVTERTCDVKHHILKILVSFLVGLIVIVLIGYLIRFTAFYTNYKDTIDSMVNTKLGNPPVSVLIMAILTGILLGLTVEVKKTTDNKFVYAFVMFSSVFTYVAIGGAQFYSDLMYLTIGGAFIDDFWNAFLYLLLVLGSNLIGVIITYLLFYRLHKHLVPECPKKCNEEEKEVVENNNEANLK